MEKPTPEEIRERRLRLGMTQRQAGAVVGAAMKTWCNWETPVGDKEHRGMPPAAWRLFILETAHILGESTDGNTLDAGTD